MNHPGNLASKTKGDLRAFVGVDAHFLRQACNLCSWFCIILDALVGVSATAQKAVSSTKEAGVISSSIGISDV